MSSQTPTSEAAPQWSWTVQHVCAATWDNDSQQRTSLSCCWRLTDSERHAHAANTTAWRAAEAGVKQISGSHNRTIGQVEGEHHCEQVRADLRARGILFETTGSSQWDDEHQARWSGTAWSHDMPACVSSRLKRLSHSEICQRAVFPAQTRGCVGAAWR